MADEEFYSVEKILKSKKFGKVTKYLVKWEGYENEEDNTWEPRENLVGDEVFDEYEKEQAAKAKKKSTPSKPIRSSTRLSAVTSIETPTSSERPKRNSDSKYANKKKVTPAKVKSPIKKPISVKPTRSSTRLSDKAKSPVKQPTRSSTRLSDKTKSPVKKPTSAKPTRSFTHLSDKDATEKSTPSDRPKRSSLSKYVKPTSPSANDETPIEKPIRRDTENEEPTPFSRPKRSSVNKEPEEMDTPTTQKQSEGIETEHPIEHEEEDVTVLPIHRAEVEPEGMEGEHPIEHEEENVAGLPTHRAEVERVTAVLGCRQEPDGSVWVICSFNDDEKDIQLTPYSIMYHHQPQILLDHWYERTVFIDVEPPICQQIA